MAKRRSSGWGLAWAWLLACAGLFVPFSAHAVEAMPLAEDPALEQHVMRIADELRCLVCQNETLAASQSALAADLRQQIALQLAGGRSPEQIRAYMVERYGEFVLYRPAFHATTALLWLGPFLLLGLSAWLLGSALRRRARETGAGALSEAERLHARKLLGEQAP